MDGPRSLRRGTQDPWRIVAKSEIRETSDEEADADPSLEKNAREERRVEAGNLPKGTVQGTQRLAVPCRLRYLLS